jgi:hypothetical protein
MNTEKTIGKNTYTAPETSVIRMHISAVLTASAIAPEGYNIDSDEFEW